MFLICINASQALIKLFSIKYLYIMETRYTYKVICIISVHQWWQKANISWATAGWCWVEDTGSPYPNQYMSATVDKIKGLWGVIVWYCHKDKISTLLIVIFTSFLINFQTFNTFEFLILGFFKALQQKCSDYNISVDKVHVFFLHLLLLFRTSR